MQIFKAKLKEVKIYINDTLVDVTMQLNSQGECFFMEKCYKSSKRKRKSSCHADL